MYNKLLLTYLTCSILSLSFMVSLDVLLLQHLMLASVCDAVLSLACTFHQNVDYHSASRLCHQAKNFTVQVNGENYNFNAAARITRLVC